MFRPTRGQGLACLLLAVLPAGCQSTSREDCYPRDPLLLSKKPVEGVADHSSGPILVASAEPTPPPVPTPALAAARKPGDAARAVPAVPVPTHSGAVPATPASRSAEPPAASGGKRAVTGKYGHAPDYTWLQGVLDRHYHGHLGLRYCDAATADPWGGKVCLDDDPRLNQFQEGDIIQVEGALVPEADPGRKGGWKHYPRFRVSEVWLVQKKN
jgi:hypothetical protein